MRLKTKAKQDWRDSKRLQILNEQAKVTRVFLSTFLTVKKKSRAGNEYTNYQKAYRPL